MWEQQVGTIARPTIWAGSGSIDATFIWVVLFDQPAQAKWLSDD